MTSSPDERELRFTVKGLGDFTSRLHELVEPGMPAVIGGPHGRFSYRKGRPKQLWIAGGVGLAPFLSWLRSLNGDLGHEVEFFYSGAGESAFTEEIRAIADRHPTLNAHFTDTTVEEYLTVERVLERSGWDPADVSVFMCGPQPMLRSFQRGLREHGVAGRHVHREYFDWR